MKTLLGVLRELVGLFVDDGSLALMLVLWCALAAFELPNLVIASGWRGPTLAIGCLAILLVNVSAAAGKKRR
jgi:hypothetical protein